MPKQRLSKTTLTPEEKTNCAYHAAFLALGTATRHRGAKKTTSWSGHALVAARRAPPAPALRPARGIARGVAVSLLSVSAPAPVTRGGMLPTLPVLLTATLPRRAVSYTHLTLPTIYSV